MKKISLIMFLIIITCIISLFAYKTENEKAIYKELILKKTDLENKNRLIEISFSFFPDRMFHGKKDKKKQLTDLASFCNVYKDQFKEIKLIINKRSYDALFYFPNGKIFYFQKGRIIPEEKLKDSDLYTSYLFKYKKGYYEIDNIRKKFPKPLCIDFYLEIYGRNPDEIFNNLGRTYVFGKRVSFNNNNRAMEKLNRAVKRISTLSETDVDIKKWIKSIKSIETYIHRNIANDNRLSLHSFGIAVDIKTRSDKEFYWNWSLPFRKDWWNIPKEDRVYVPQSVIDAFEEAGFAWGGKWFYFDNMHFEYRPEAVL